MRILLYGINYAPELTGIGKYTGEMCAFLANQGHTVHVVTAMPYYPRWKKHEHYQGKWWHKENISGVTVYRCPLYIPKNVTPLRRIAHEFSFIASSFPVWLKRLFAKKYDAVISVSPPFHLGFLPLLYSFLRRTPVINHIQDLQVDVAKDMGMIKHKKFLSAMFAAEKFVLQKCTAVTTISNGMLKKITAKGIELSKCYLLPNWVDEETIRPLKKKDSLRETFGINQTDKVILYSGNLGEKQGLENIIESALAFRNRKDVHFVIVGSGGAKKKLREAAKTNCLDNVRFYPLQPYDNLSALLAIADVHLVLQKKSAADLVMPSKLTSILAAGGVPIVTACEGTYIHEIITKHHMGIIAEPDDAQALTEAINYALITNLAELALNARNYAEIFLSRNTIMAAWQIELQEILMEKSASSTHQGAKTVKSKKNPFSPLALPHQENIILNVEQPV